MIHFLASMPRSGSTLLASLLGQRADTYVSPTSNLGETLGAVVYAFENNPATQAGECTKEELYRTLKGVVDAKYFDRSETVILDKGRNWPLPQITATMNKSLGKPIKIVATVRPIAECIASFFLIDKGKDIKTWMRHSPLFVHLMQSYYNLKDGYEANPDQYCLVEYDTLVNHTQKELDRISDFLCIDRQKFSSKIEEVKENDNAWGVENLHTLGNKIYQDTTDAKQILGRDLFELYSGGEFWNDKPEPIKPKQLIDFSLEAGLRGDFNKGWEVLNKAFEERPDDVRVKFNLGWYEMWRGNLLKGSRLLDQGRNDNVFGGSSVATDKPLWNGEKNCTVLLELEGGLGDRFHCIRYAKEIASCGNKVVVGGDMNIAPILIDVDGVSAITQHEGSNLMHFDYWVPAMSAGMALKQEWTDVTGTPYIKRTAESENKIGVRWSGNPMFEHQQHRVFDAELMFDLVKDSDCISLQKDDDDNADGLVLAPDWMEKPTLETWQDTQRAISRCDLVITSCTGVAHLAGAMGVETWIVVPILPYYLWSLPGNKTPHYDSVTLFRQEAYGCWKAPFKKLKKQLQLRASNINASLYNDISADNQQFIEM